MKHSVRMLALTLTFALSIAFTLMAQTAQLPSGNWTLSHHPYSRPGHEKLPVMVTSVKGDANKALLVSVVGLKNQTSKPVNAYKLSWYLYREEAPNRILQSGDTPVIYPANLAAKDQRRVDIPVVSFIDICKPLVKDGSLTGNFAIDIAVTEVQYEDGTTWKGEGLPAVVKK